MTKDCIISKVYDLFLNKMAVSSYILLYGKINCFDRWSVGIFFATHRDSNRGGIGLPFTQNTPPSIGVFAFDLLLFIFSYFTGQKQKSISEINLVDQIKYFLLLLLILLPPPPPLPPTRQNIVMTLSTLVCCHGCKVGTSFCVLILISHIIVTILVYYFLTFFLLCIQLIFVRFTWWLL